MRRLPLLYGIYGADSPDFLYKIERSFLGGVGIFQLRVKNKEKREVLELSEKVKKICRAYGVIFIINDDPDIALEVEADGVHIGREDGDIEYVKKMVGDKIVGVSCYDNIERALYAEEKGADYVSFSSPFPSPTKKDKKNVPIELIKKAQEKIKIPLYVIGGINKNNVSEILSNLKCGVCAISGIYDSYDPFLTAFAIREKIIFYNEGSLTF